MDCKHLKTTRVSSDVPDYYQCDNCGKQFTESEVVELKDTRECEDLYCNLRGNKCLYKEAGLL